MKIIRAADFVLLLFGCCATIWVARGGDAKKNTTPDYRKWNGAWLLDCEYEPGNLGVKVTVTNARSATPTFTAEFWNAQGQCTIGSDQPQFRIPFLKADVTGLHLHHGKIYFCTTAKALADAKNLTAVFDSDFEGDFDPATDTIHGHAKSEYWWSPDDKPEHNVRKPSGDRSIDVTLVLKAGQGVGPRIPPDKDPTPTPDPSAALNNTAIKYVNKFFEGERAKNPYTHPP